MAAPLATCTESVFDRLTPDEQEAIIEVVAECLLAQALEDLAKKSEPTLRSSCPTTPAARPVRAHLRLARSRRA